MTDPNDNLRAARLLAGVLYTDTGIDIEPAVLCAFINSRWSKVAPLAHRVHAALDTTKEERAWVAGQTYHRGGVND